MKNIEKIYDEICRLNSAFSTAFRKFDKHIDKLVECVEKQEKLLDEFIYGNFDEQDKMRAIDEDAEGEYYGTR